MATIDGSYRVARGAVIYTCPRCGVELRSPLDEAGQPERCPECSAAVTVPGQAEKVQRDAEVQRQRAAAEALKKAEMEAKRKIAQRRAAAIARSEQGRTWIGRAAGPLNVLGCMVIVLATLYILLGFFFAIRAAFIDNNVILAAYALLVSIAIAVPMLGLGWALNLFAGMGKVLVDIADRLDPEREQKE